MFRHNSGLFRFAAVMLIGALSLAVASGGVAAERGEEKGKFQSMRSGSAEQEHVQFLPQYESLVAPSGDVVVGDFTPEQPSSVAFAGAASGMSSYTGVSGANGGAGAQAMDDYKAGPGCMVQCITRGVAYARGVNAELFVETDTPARIWISVWNEDGYSQLFSTGQDEVTSFSGFFDGLEPDTTYQAMATASDGQYTSVAVGSFTTLTRNVTVSFTHATIHEAPSDNGTFGWATWLDGTGYLEEPGTSGIEAEGAQIPLGIQSLTFEDVDTQYLGLGFLFFHSEPDSGPVGCGAWALPHGLGDGSEGCTTWAPTFLPPPLNDLDARPAGATSWTEHNLTWEMPGQGGGDLNVSIPLNLHVWYD